MMRPLPVKTFSESVLRSPGNQDLVNGLVIFLAVCAILYYGQPILILIVLAILLGDIIVGIVGSAIASLLLPRLGILIGGGVLGAIINATIGACILLFVLRLARRG
jgi:Transglycosylase associated protein